MFPNHRRAACAAGVASPCVAVFRQTSIAALARLRLPIAYLERPGFIGFFPPTRRRLLRGGQLPRSAKLPFATRLDFGGLLLPEFQEAKRPPFHDQLRQCPYRRIHSIR